MCSGVSASGGTYLLPWASQWSAFLPRLFPTPIVTATLIPVLISSAVAALLLIILTRGRLSYERYEREVVQPTSQAVVEQEPSRPFPSR
jgi:hypothetical protein